MDLNKELLEKMDNSDKLELLEMLETNLINLKCNYDKMIRETHSGVYDYSITISEDKEVIDSLVKKIDFVKEFTELEQNNSLDM